MIGVELAETLSAVALSLILRRRGWLSLAIEHLVVRGRLVEVREHRGRLGGGQMPPASAAADRRVLATALQATVPTIASPITIAAYTYAAEPPSGGLCVVGPPGPARPASHFIAGTLTEVGHHGTQIGALRDLYAWRHFDHDRA